MISAIVSGVSRKLKECAGFYRRRYVLFSPTPLTDTIACSLSNCRCRVTNFIWVSHKLKLIYFETPKCGCASIKKAFDIEQTDEIFVFAYIIQRRKNSVNRELPILLDVISEGNIAYMTSSKFQRCYQKALQKISEGCFESDPNGKFQFSHYFGTASNILSDYPHYQTLCVVRDPIERFVSGLNMFYGSFSGRRQMQFRRRQRLMNSSLGDVSKASTEEIVRDILRHSNHHFNPIQRFIGEEVDIEKINFVDIRNLNQHWRSMIRDFGLLELEHINAATQYTVQKENLGSTAKKLITDYCEPDLDILARARIVE